MDSTNATASLPLKEEPSMWLTSNRLAFSRQCLVASMMESLYMIGIECPAKGTCGDGRYAGHES